jgi:purine-binding chemotaxis protein CheW
VLVVRAGERLCALPIGSVVEAMRPLPVTSLAGAPPYVRGVAIVRGEPVPVVDLAALIGAGGALGTPGRFVSVHAGGRAAALAVAGVVGVTTLDLEGERRMPLLAEACTGTLSALRTRDDDLLLVLGAARLVPEDATAAVQRREVRP